MKIRKENKEAIDHHVAERGELLYSIGGLEEHKHLLLTRLHFINSDLTRIKGKIEEQVGYKISLNRNTGQVKEVKELNDDVPVIDINSEKKIDAGD